MDKRKSIFIFEYLSCGGLCKDDVPLDLLAEGFAMLTSLIYDFSDLGFQINLIIDERIKEDFFEIHKQFENISYCFLTKLMNLEDHIKELTIKSEYILIIGPESNNILFNLTYLVETIAKNYEDKKLLSPNTSFVLPCSDKVITESVLNKIGAKFPFSFSIESFLAYYDSIAGRTEPPQKSKKIKHQFIIKPTDGVGCMDTFCFEYSEEQFETERQKIVNDIHRLMDYFDQQYPNIEFIIQRKMEGLTLSISAINRNGVLSFYSINQQVMKCSPIKILPQLDNLGIFKIEYIGGLSPYFELPQEISLFIRSITNYCCRQYNFCGFFGIDFIFDNNHSRADDPENIWFLEVNPRITTPYIAYSKLLKEQNICLASLYFTDTLDLSTNSNFHQIEYTKDQNKNRMVMRLKI